MSLLKTLFCNHTSQSCLTNFDSKYIDSLYSGEKPATYTLWKCERCGKIIKKKIKEEPSTFNWLNIRIISEEEQAK